MVGRHEVVVDGLGNPNDLDVHLLVFEETIEAVARVHRVIAAINEEVADIPTLNGIDDFGKEGIFDAG